MTPVEDMDEKMEFELIRNMKRKDRTDEQHEYFNRIRRKGLRKKETTKESDLRKENNRKNMKHQRKLETVAETALRKQNDRENKKHQRELETLAETELRKEKHCENIKRQRELETVAETALRKQNDRKNKKHQRELETLAETALRKENDRKNKKQKIDMETKKQRSDRCKKNKENMRKIRNTDTEGKRLKKFRESVKYGPMFTCTVCEQDMFINSVSVITEEFKENVQQKNSELFNKAFANKHPVGFNKELKTYICGTCKTSIKHEKLPSMAAANGLNVIPLKDVDLHLTELENNLIAKRIMFQKIYQLPKSRMAACKDHLINIPINSEDVMNTLQSLPRTPEEAGLLEVKLKRRLNYKSTHQQAYIDTRKIYKALDFLKSSGHPEYQFYDDQNVYMKRCQQLKAQYVNDSQVEIIMERNEFIKKLEYEISKEKGGEVSDEEEEYRKNDVIRKFQFDYDTSVCLVDKFPEAALPEQVGIDTNQISFAPGEGKIPENILTTKYWDRNAFPMKHPDGQNNLHHTRVRKLTEQYYFVQRLRN